MLFNLGNCAATCICSAEVYNRVLQLAPSGDTGRMLALTAFTTVYFTFNTLGVALAIALAQKLSWTEVWKQNFLWTAPGYFASASAAAAVALSFNRLGILSLLILPWLYIIFYSYRLYMDRLHRDMSHIVELNKLNQAVIASLATAIDAKDRHTCSHINRVQYYAVQLAEALGLKGPELSAVTTGALVHDIGKLGIPDHILLKPGKLTAEEFQRMQTHVTIGAEILAPVPFPFPVVDVVMTHHERWDGLGYPRQLEGEEIPIGGRIISIVDVFDALTSHRPYRRAMTWEQASQVLAEGAGKQFDPALVKKFLVILPRLQGVIDQMDAEQRERLVRMDQTEETGSALARIGQAAAEMAAACSVAHALSEQDTIAGIGGVVVSRALALMPVDTVVFYSFSPDDNSLRATQADGKYAERLVGMEIQRGEGVSGWVAAHQQPKVNVSASLDVARRFSPEENLELSAATAVPVLHGPNLIGVLTVYTTAYSVLSQHHLHVLNLLAEHAAGAMQNLHRIEQHRELAFTDPLTGLANSRCLFRQLERLTQSSRADGTPSTRFSVLMLDLDGFKQVNDQLGHLCGDELLRSIAQVLIEVARPNDLVCRYAGDEFVLLLSDVGADEAERVAARAKAAITEIGLVEGCVAIGASTGIASYPAEGEDGKSLLNIADFRMYEDKYERRRRRGGGLPEKQRQLAAA
jgi:diguanylate cyclase (GGDEF)-like protein/putative nucleotidyltransferase with HDIG domain